MGRWLIAVAVLAVLTVVVTVAINMFGGSTRDVQVPDVKGQLENDAIATLQNARLQDDDSANPDSTIPPNRVIGTDPSAGTSDRRRRRDHHQRVDRPGAARGRGLQGPDLRRLRPEAHRTPGSASSRNRSPSRRQSRRTGCSPPSRRPIRRRRSRTRSRSSWDLGPTAGPSPTAGARPLMCARRCSTRPAS